MATPSMAGPKGNSNDRQMDRAVRAILRMLKDEANALFVWTIAISGALVAFWLSEGTSYHQLAVGLLMSSGTLFVLMGLFEFIWRTISER
jgi:hypothetical protein